VNAREEGKIVGVCALGRSQRFERFVVAIEDAERSGKPELCLAALAVVRRKLERFAKQLEGVEDATGVQAYLAEQATGSKKRPRLARESSAALDAARRALALVRGGLDARGAKEGVGGARVIRGGEVLRP
jgi:hypothetical protein